MTRILELELHEADENYELFSTGRLISLLEIVGGGRVVCDKCGRWSRFAALNSEMAKQDLEQCGWKITIGGADTCPKCLKSSKP